MGLQGLGVKKLHHMEDITGLRILVARINNGHDWRTWLFTTDDHQHGIFNRTSGGWELYDPTFHWSSCRLLFGTEPKARDDSWGTICSRGDWHVL